MADDQGNENTFENTVDRWLMIRVNEYIRKYCRQVADDQGNENILENTVDRWLMIRVMRIHQKVLQIGG